MRLVPTGRGSEVRVVFDVAECGHCHAGFDRLGTFAPIPHACSEHESGHYELRCRACQLTTWDSWCRQIGVQHNPLEAHAADGKWASVQEGPTFDVGDG